MRANAWSGCCSPSRPLITLDRPVIAKVDGAAYGAGLGLALTADLVLATPRARFCLSFLRLGAIPDCGTLYTLPRIVGLQRAKELAYSAREFNAEEARDMGIVLDILPPERIDAHARQIALAMAGLPAGALFTTKRGLNASLNSDLHTMLESGTGDHREAVGRSWPTRRAISANVLRRRSPRFPDARTLATSDALTAPAWLPQLDRTKLTTAATSLSVMRQSKPGIAYWARPWCPASAPLSTIWISEAGSAELTVELSANCGKVSA